LTARTKPFLEDSDGEIGVFSADELHRKQAAQAGTAADHRRIVGGLKAGGGLTVLVPNPAISENSSGRSGSSNAIELPKPRINVSL
jgi:hypothetical protein